MTPNEMRDIYVEACQAKGFIPDEGQLKMWRKVLGFFDEKIVESALTLWFQERSDFPMPGGPDGLLQYVERAKRRSLVNIEAERSKKYHSFICDYCGHSEAGFFVPSDPVLSRTHHCRSMYGPIGSNEILPRGTICGREMRVERFESYEEAVAKERAYAEQG